jgi:hypothetical protein
LTEYEHTQTGTLQRALLRGFALFSGGSGVLTAFNSTIRRALPLLFVSVVLVGLACLFDSLTVKVSRTYISIKFGIGIIMKRFAVGDVQNAAIVRNHWYYGWGIRLTPHGWLYNVSGLDAVEIRLRNGKKYRIGTDEPVQLLSVIQAAMLE